MRMKVVEFKQPLEDLAGALVDLLDVGVLVKVFAEEIPEILDLHPHRQGEGDQPTPEGAGIGSGGGTRLLQIDDGLTHGVLDQVVGQTAGDEAPGALGIEPGVVAADSGFRLLPEFNPEKGGGVEQAAFQGVLQIVTAVGDLVGQIHGLGFKGRLGVRCG